MKFLPIKARPQWREQAREIGYLASLMDDPPYWVEALPEPFCAVFSQKEKNEIFEPAIKELNDLTLRAVENICFGDKSDQLMDQLQIPLPYRSLIRLSWKRRDRSLYGRYDFAYSNGQLKLLELNFDTPGSLYESSIFQLLWLKEMQEQNEIDGSASQMNSIHQDLVEAFSALLATNPTIHFATNPGSAEEEDTTRYLQSCAILAGVRSKFLYMNQLGTDREARLVDLEDEDISLLYKMYAWEYLIADDQKIIKESGKSFLMPLLEYNSTSILEPVWKCLLTNKGIIPILWKMAPESPWLLESYFEDNPASEKIKNRPYARKPLLGRQGANISLIYPDQPRKSFINPGPYAKDRYVLQEIHELEQYQDYHFILGAWTICGKASGLSVRADRNSITTNDSCIFIPHIVENN